MDHKIRRRYRHVKCPHCELFFSKYGLPNHIWIKHSERGAEFLKKLSTTNGFSAYNLACKNRTITPWNKGLDKQTDERVKNRGITYSQRVKDGSIIPFMRGKHLSDETKKKLSVSRTNYLLAHPDQVPYILNHSSKRSYPELMLDKALNNSQLTGWTTQYQQGLYSYDFAFPSIKLDIEIDGGTHTSEKVLAKDLRRDTFSASLGWVVIRFPASKIKKDLDLCIETIKEIVSILSK